MFLFVFFFQLEKTLKTEREYFENTLKNEQNKRFKEINDLQSSYELQLKTETENSSNLKSELGITKKKLAMLGFFDLKIYILYIFYIHIGNR